MARAVLKRHPSLDLENWQDTVKRLYSGEFAAGPTDPLLAETEQGANASTEHFSRIWLVSLFALILSFSRGRRLNALREADVRAIIAASEDPPDTHTAVQSAGHAFALGARIAQREMRPTPGGTRRPPTTGRPPGGRERLFAEWLARQSAASKMREWADGMRQDVRWQVVQAIREGATTETLRQRLETRWERYGQNFALIAQTELALAYNGGYLLSLPEHSYVYVPPIGDGRVCQKCKTLLEGRVFEVLHEAPEHPAKLDWETKIWPGKPGKRPDTGQDVPTVPMHPGCRHRAQWYSGKPRQERR